MDYQVRAILAAILLMNQPKSFLWDTFVDTNVSYSTAEIAEVDIERASGERLAPLVASTIAGIVMDRTGFDTALVKFPTIAPERLVTVEDLNQRQFGEGLYSGRTAADRENSMIARDYMELKRAIMLRKNHFVSQVLFGTPGKLELDVMTETGIVKGALKVDYGFSNVVTVTLPWTDPASHPTNDLEALEEEVIKGGGAADIIVMGSAAAQAYRTNPNTKEMYNIRNANYGVLSASYVGPFLKFLGTNASGTEMYSYNAIYLGDDGITKPMVPTDMVFVGSRSILRAVFGPVTQIDFGEDKHTTYVELQEVPNRIVKQESNVIANRLTSRPMIIPKNIDGWAVAKTIF